MATFWRHTRLWRVDYRFDGRPRCVWRAFAPDTDVAAAMADELHALHAGRARLVSVRPASAEEERAYLRGEEPRLPACPSGRAPLSGPGPGPEDEDPAPAR